MSEILLLTNSRDGENTASLERELERLGASYLRVDSDRVFARGGQLIMDFGDSPSGLHLFGVDPRDVKSVWFRRPYTFDLPISDGVQRAAAEKEVRSVMNSWWDSLSHCQWINPLASVARAQLKPLQLRLAQGLGIKFPSTLITNNVRQALDFCEGGPTVLKPMAEPNLEYPGLLRTVFTTLIEPRHVSMMGMIENQPVMLQRSVEKSYELRVTIMDENVFATRIAHPDYPRIVDWRAPEYCDDVSYSQEALNGSLVVKLQLLMKALRLRYGAIDLAVGTDGEVYFLEVNPVGQWLWLEEHTGAPITASIARSLNEGR